ncbi:hypothetical protein [Cellulomonas sp. PhB143]|uniref:hypothetical protein n=1 Tax=Cellulomonas sp. PhB143 TaxID=2485186 RepID=UPI000F989107|nr:hypothetical protein [Cellulomonas sp. PhB143]ROS75484.1 hypothetical protein EDF32_1894 [Cellulomonas sp. PhB143]
MSDNTPGDIQRPTGQPAPQSKAEAKRAAREAKAVKKANRNWFARHKFLTFVGAVVVLIIVISVATSGGGDDKTPAADTPAGTTASEPAADDVAADDAKDEDAKDEDASKKDAPAEDAEPELSDGDYIVGTDIEPGQYRAHTTEGVIALCTISQTADNDDVIGINNGSEGDVIFTVTDKPGTDVSFSGCEDIVNTADVPGEKVDTIKNGDYLVGPQIDPGKYVGTVDTDAIMVLGTITQTKGNDDVIGINNGDAGNVNLTVKDVEGSVVSFDGFKEIKKVS